MQLLRKILMIRMTNHPLYLLPCSLLIAIASILIAMLNAPVYYFGPSVPFLLVSFASFFL